MKANLNRRGPAQSLKSMLAVDFRRMFTMPMLYILVGACLAMPILILVMTTMMDGGITVDPQTGVETVIEGFDNVWQIIGSASGSGMTDVYKRQGNDGGLQGIAHDVRLRAQGDSHQV